MFLVIQGNRNNVTTSNSYGYDECLNDNCYAIYNFELFTEVGTKNKFQENSYTETINEEFNDTLEP